MQYTVFENKRHCLECGETIDYRSRLDKVFCCNACKNHYNYTLRRSREKFDKINDILSQNYAVLKRLFSSQVRSISLCDITYLGFNPGYMTSCVRRHSFSECCCYDFRYKMTATRIFAIEPM